MQFDKKKIITAVIAVLTAVLGYFGYTLTVTESPTSAPAETEIHVPAE